MSRLKEINEIIANLEKERDRLMPELETILTTELHNFVYKMEKDHGVHIGYVEMRFAKDQETFDDVHHEVVYAI